MENNPADAPKQTLSNEKEDTLARSRRMVAEEGEAHRRVTRMQGMVPTAEGTVAERTPNPETGRLPLPPLYQIAAGSELYNRRVKRWQTISHPREYFDGDTIMEDSEPEIKAEEQKFNVYQAILNHQEIVHELATQLDVEDFVNLYAVCKVFNGHVNNQFTRTMLGNARVYAPESVKVFPFKCYLSLCIYDPTKKVNEEVLRITNKTQVRDVPGLKWLRMIYFREEIVDSIIIEIAELGHPLPPQTSMVLKKIWFLMDFPDNNRRIGLIHNPKYWSNMDLFYATLFFMKLDMSYTDPLDGGARPMLRELLLGQRSLSVLEKVLRREKMRNPWELMQMCTEWNEPPAGHAAFAAHGNGLHDASVVGVPLNRVGSLSREGWTNTNGPLLRPDTLVMRESLRRGLRMDRWYLDMMLWGYIDKKTGKDYWPPSVQKAMAEGAPPPEPSFNRETAVPEDSDTVDIGHQRYDVFAKLETKQPQEGEPVLDPEEQILFGDE